MLEQLTGWNVWIWRAIFLGQFVFGFSLLLPLSFSGYLLCALVFPRKEKEY